MEKKDIFGLRGAFPKLLNLLLQISAEFLYNFEQNFFENN